MSHEQVTEYVDSRGVSLKVDREAGVIRGVKILGLESGNGRIYPKETIARAQEQYEGIKVNVDHPPDPKRPLAPRRYADRIGELRNPRIGQGDGGLFADFHFNPKHAMAEQLCWDAENQPSNVGFSHNALAKLDRRGGKNVVEEILGVHAVDLVTNPATTKGLFEGLNETELPEKGDTTMETTITLESLRAQQPALVEQISKVAVEAFQQSEAEKAKTVELTTLKEELDAFKLKETLAAEREIVAKLIEEAKLPETAVSEVFVEQLVAADAKKRQQIIEDRQELVKAGGRSKPQSKEQGTVDRVTEGDVSQMDAKQRRRRYTG